MVVVVVAVVVVDGDVSSVVVVCEIVSRCDVWHEKTWLVTFEETKMYSRVYQAFNCELSATQYTAF